MFVFFLVTCCGFVTFTNPRSAIDAINDMNGRTIDGLVVKVSEVTTRNGRSNFGCDSFRHNPERGHDWQRGKIRFFVAKFVLIVM